MRQYIVRKDHKMITATTKAGAYEAWDSFGRHDVTIMERIQENGKEYVHIGHKARRTTTKSGEVRYHFYWENIYRKDV